MARFVSPITDMKPNGSLRFFKSGTNTTLVTYKDELETPGLENPVIVPVLPNGNVQNVFYQGSAKVQYLDEFGQQYEVRDPVGGERELGNFTLWGATVTYDLNNIVLGSDGNFYISLSNGNIGNDPTITDSKWKEWPPITIWNTNITYSIGDVVQTTDGSLWKAITATAGNDPSTDDGTNWLPAIDASASLIWLSSTPYIIGDVVKTSNGNLWKAASNNTGNDPSTDDGTNWLPSVDSDKLGLVHTEIVSTTATFSRQAKYSEYTLISAIEMTFDNTFKLNDIIVVDKVHKSHISKIIVTAGIIRDENVVNIGTFLDLDAGNSAIVRLVKDTVNWTIKVT